MKEFKQPQRQDEGMRSRRARRPLFPSPLVAAFSTKHADFREGRFPPYCHISRTVQKLEDKKVQCHTSVQTQNWRPRPESGLGRSRPHRCCWCCSCCQVHLQELFFPRALGTVSDPSEVVFEGCKRGFECILGACPRKHLQHFHGMHPEAGGRMG